MKSKPFHALAQLTGLKASETVSARRQRWTKEECLEKAKEFQSRTEWHKKDPSSYVTAQRNGWFKECVVHMTRPYEPHKWKWTKEACLIAAKKFNSRCEWGTVDPNSYQAARRNGWLEECSAHMTRIRVPKEKWTLEKLMAIALQFPSRGQWYVGHQASYRMARKLGVFEQCVAHMKPSQLEWPKGRTKKVAA